VIDVNETRKQTTLRHESPDQRPHATEATIAWLEAEFPGWGFDVDETATWEGDLRALWIARRDGHHPQAELTPAKLHTRLVEYLEREERRRALSN
jgi:hypothetical protein